MKVAIYKVEIDEVFDCNISPKFRNILTDNGWTLNKSEDSIGYTNTYPKGKDYSTWYAQDQCKSATYAEYPMWFIGDKGKENSQGTLLLSVEQFSDFMFEKEFSSEENIKIISVSKCTMDVQHPVEKLMNEIGEIFTKGMTSGMINYMIKQDKK